MAPLALEQRRLAALERLGIMDTGPEESFDRLVNIARRFYNTPIAMFSLVDEKRQWFKSKHGLDVCQTPRSLAFCDYAIKQDSVFVVADATKDPRFCTNSLVTGEPHIRFYAGMPVREPGGFKIGTLCIIDRVPRGITEPELDVLRTLASLIEDEVERSYFGLKHQRLVPVSRLNRAIHRAQNVFHTDNNQDAAFELLLSDLLVLTDSQVGFIGEVLTNSGGNPYLHVRAITDIARDSQSKPPGQQRQGSGTLVERLDTLIGASLLSLEVILENEFDTDASSGGLPPDH